MSSSRDSLLVKGSVSCWFCLPPVTLIPPPAENNLQVETLLSDPHTPLWMQCTSRTPDLKSDSWFRSNSDSARPHAVSETWAWSVLWSCRDLDLIPALRPLQCVKVLFELFTGKARPVSMPVDSVLSVSNVSRRRTLGRKGEFTCLTGLCCPTCPCQTRTGQLCPSSVIHSELLLRHNL